MAMVPCLVKGQMTELDDSLLERREGGHDNDNETANWVEYWLDGECVHRSAHVHLKKAIFGEGGIASFG